MATPQERYTKQRGIEHRFKSTMSGENDAIDNYIEHKIKMRQNLNMDALLQEELQEELEEALRKAIAELKL